MDGPHNNVDFAIVGGGILGTAVAALASAVGYGVVVFRLGDEIIPRADTLRNQGWLQSGVMYHIGDFGSEADYERFATSTYFAGLRMLKECGLPQSNDRGIVCVKRADRLADLHRKCVLLRFSQDEFRRLERDEIGSRIKEFADPDYNYFVIPDTPFNEAGVLRHLRDSAIGNGAHFCEVQSPVTLEPHGDVIRIRYGEAALEAPLTLVAAGAGSFELLAQVGRTIDGELRRTPLLVSDRPCGMPSSIFVDIDRGFSAVRHLCDGLSDGAVVVGTRARKQPAPAVLPDDRRIPRDEQETLKECLHPKLAASLLPGRLTAGYEVIPKLPKRLTAFEPWIEDFGNVVFASPGRATMGLFAATETFYQMEVKVRETGRRQFSYYRSDQSQWQGQINMHYTPAYSFDDAEA